MERTLLRHGDTVGQGFWGEVTASVDWCEINYQVSHYICEFFNTFSSISMCFVGILGYYLQKDFLETRFVVALSMITIVGLGSFAFHATLKQPMQMLDEVPMLWDALSLTYILLENEHAKLYHGAWFPVFLVFYGVGASVLVAFTSGLMQFVAFHVSFALLEFFCLYRIYSLKKEFSGEKKMNQIADVGFYTFCAALFCWQLDINFCKTLSHLPFGIPNPQFHSWWHVLVSIGLYDLTTFIVYRRQEVLFKAGKIKTRPTVRWFLRSIPYVILVQGGSKYTT